jgi:hypothetical protein
MFSVMKLRLCLATALQGANPRNQKATLIHLPDCVTLVQAYAVSSGGQTTKTRMGGVAETSPFSLMNRSIHQPDGRLKKNIEAGSIIS